MTIDFERDVAALREAGFALHWLHPRTKRPIGKEWSEAPVATVEDLRRTFSPSNNLGLRLGEPSRVGDRFAHVFDMDIRIAELADEAWGALRDLLPGIDLKQLPTVQSGSGGESRHIHFVTDRAFHGHKLAVSEGKHRDAKGKWHYDWEIVLYGTGMQVAMPPSIHPDTGKPYIWLTEYDLADLEFGGGPVIPASVIEGLGAIETSDAEYESRPPLDFKAGQLERDLSQIPVARLDDYFDWVMLGQALHHQFGASDEGFDLWVAQSKRSDKFEGTSVAEMKRKWRRFGRHRGKPVTMATIRLWAQEARAEALVDEFDDFEDEGALESQGTSDDSDFDALVDGPAAASTEVTQKDIDDFDSAPEKPDKLSWVSLLEVNEETRAPKATLHNLELIVKNDPRLVGLAQINEFTQETVQRTPPGKKGQRRNAAKDTRQLNGRVWQVEDTLNGELWSDDRDFAIRSIIEAPKTQGGYSIKVSDRDLKAAIVLAANENAFHPVREYLTGLKWDGTERVDRLWVDYVGATDDIYHRHVARLMMVAAVTRIFEPGHKFDYATILEGLQGKRKSTLIEILGKRWFAELDGDWHDRKALVELMQGAWIMEIPELTGFQRSDVRAIKAFISAKKDRVRLAYARRAGEFPRQCIFIGSTNDREYLKDDTGGRRFWPVQCRLEGEIDTEALTANIDQLWAEAVQIYRQMRVAKPSGTLPLYLADAESRAIAARLQESRRVESPDDVLAGQIEQWLRQPINSGSIDGDFDSNGKPLYREDVCTAMVWVEMLGKEMAHFDTQAQGKVNRAMAKLADWLPDGSMRFARYGKQRVFRKIGNLRNVKSD